MALQQSEAHKPHQMQTHHSATMLKRKSVERDQQRSRNSQSVLRSPHGEHVYLSVEVDLYPAEYSPTCDPERLHDIVEWIYSNGTRIFKRAWMRFTSRGIVFEEQMVDFSEQIASSTLYKIKNVKGLWVDPTFRSFIAIVVRCSRSSLMIFVVRIVSGTSMAKIVESFHAMKKHNAHKKHPNYSIDKFQNERFATGRCNRSKGFNQSPDLNGGRNMRYRSSSIDVRMKRSVGRHSRSRDNCRKYRESSSSEERRENSSISEDGSRSVKSLKNMQFSVCNGRHSDTSQQSERRSAGTQSIPPQSDNSEPNKFVTSNSKQIGVQYEELGSDTTGHKSEDYSSISSNTRQSKEKIKGEESKSTNNSEKPSGNPPPIDALFRELHVVREQLEQLKVPDEGRFRWFETDMEQMKNELRQIRAKLDDCVITCKPDIQTTKASNDTQRGYLQRVVKVKRSIERFDSSEDRKQRPNNVRLLVNNLRNTDCSSSAEYENVSYLKRVLPVDPYTNSQYPIGQLRNEVLHQDGDRYHCQQERNQLPLRIPREQDVNCKPDQPIPFMTPFFANQLTNPMLSNDRKLLINTLANQFGLPLDSKELADIANDQSRYLTGRRTFANIIWNMSAEEEAILRRKSPSPPQGQPFDMRLVDLMCKNKSTDNGILSKGRKRANKSVTFCLATG